MKRKRAAHHRVPPPPTAEDCDFLPSPTKHASDVVRIESPIVDFSNSNSRVCSISDDIVPAKRQSSLLSFFTKERRAKQQQQQQQQQQEPKSKSKQANDHSTNRKSFFSSAKTNRTISSSNSRTKADSSTLLPSARCSTIALQKQKSLTQVYIDAGQKRFGQIICSKCGMLYVPGVAEDEAEHKKMCEAYALGIPCHRVKGGKILKKNNNASNESIVLWRPSVKKPKQKPNSFDTNNDSSNSDCPSQWPLLAKMISKDLGTHEETTLSHLTHEMVFLCIGKAPTTKANKSRILGVATVQLLGSLPSYRMMDANERSLTPCKTAKLGIGLLWTHPVSRKRGIATKLVHAAREHAVFGMRVSRRDVAFSNPTLAGYNFALNYCNNSDNGTDGTPLQGPLVYEMDL